jgi:transcriptional regulator with XRE-family HTH domain
LTEEDAMTSVRDIRQSRGLTPEQISSAAGMTLMEYYDLESYEDDLNGVVSLDRLWRVARELGVMPSAFFGGTSQRQVSVSELASAVRAHLDTTKEPLADFEERVGWELSRALSNPVEFRSFSADGVRDVCAAVHVGWLDVLDGLGTT